MPGLYYLKKHLEKWPFLDQNHGLTPLEKCQFFDFFNFFFLQPRNAFFRSRISYKTFAWPILPEKRKLEKWPFLDQNHGLTPLKKVDFSTFLTSCFYSLERPFFVLEYRKIHLPGLHWVKKQSWKNGHFRTKTMG